MEIFISTPRLILRELIPSDAAGMFELDSDKDVHLYLGNQPLTHIDQSKEVIRFIRQQYEENGIGRWAVIEKSTNRFIGWAGLKLVTTPVNGHVNYYDLGYRFIKQYWGKGYATECTKALLEYGFIKLQQEVIYAMTDAENMASARVLEKNGFRQTGVFDDEGVPHKWFEISKATWQPPLPTGDRH